MITFHSVTPLMFKALTRLIQHGLHEWVQMQTEPMRRATLISDDAFLPNIADHLERTTDFRCLVTRGGTK